MSANGPKEIRFRPCPCCGANIWADDDRRKNFRRWSIAFKVLLWFAITATVIGLIAAAAGGPTGLICYGTGMILTAAVLRGGHNFWRVRKKR